LRLFHRKSLARQNVLTLDRNRLSNPCARRTGMDCMRSASTRRSLPFLKSRCAQQRPDSTEKAT
jgi:hypothetical protein